MHKGLKLTKEQLEQRRFLFAEVLEDIIRKKRPQVFAPRTYTYCENPPPQILSGDVEKQITVEPNLKELHEQIEIDEKPFNETELEKYKLVMTTYDKLSSYSIYLDQNDVSNLLEGKKLKYDV